MSQNYFDDVGNFHERFGLGRYGFSLTEIIDNDVFLFRYQFLQEELHELLSAHRSGDLAGVADALADLVYVALGTAHMYGIPFDEVWTAVHGANMRKVRSTAGDVRSKRGHVLDVVKPKGWTPPDVASIIERYGEFLRPERFGEFLDQNGGTNA